MISPNPVQPKVVTVVNATGTLSKTINKGATWKLSASFNKLTVLWKNGDLCEDSVINLPFWTGHIYITGLKCPQVCVLVNALMFRKRAKSRFRRVRDSP